MQINKPYRSIPVVKGISSDEISRFSRFILVGMTGTVLDFGLLMVFKSMGLNTLISNTLSFSAGTTNSFTLNRTWTFKGGYMPAWQR